MSRILIHILLIVACGYISFVSSQTSSRQDLLDQARQIILSGFNSSIVPIDTADTAGNRSTLTSSADAEEDKNLNITEIITKYGYPVEQHEVVSDGYILTMFRIPAEGKTPVYLQHGLFSSSDDWVTSGPKRGLAFLLYRAGYDVWLGNARGNKHSRRHKTISPESDKFWTFSFHEMGYDDLPACIDYILKETKFAQIKYIGHWQGTAIFIVMTTLLPEYNNKVSYMIAFGLSTYLGHITSPVFKLIAPISYDENGLLRQIVGPEFLPDNDIIRILRTVLCAPGLDPIQEALCANIFFLALGFDNEQLDFERLPAIISHVPSGIATRQLQHIEQSVINDDFNRFDFGTIKNMAKYGSVKPPPYPLNKITVPQTIFQGDSDAVSNIVDINRYIQEATSANVSLYRIPYDKFAHLDFLFAKDVDTLLYNKVLEVLKNN